MIPPILTHVAVTQELATQDATNVEFVMWEPKQKENHVVVSPSEPIANDVVVVTQELVTKEVVDVKAVTEELATVE